MTKEIGTLEELDVKHGDVVECVNASSNTIPGERYTVNEERDIGYCSEGLTKVSTFRIISRASDDTPKLWRDMTDNVRPWKELTDEEKGALLLAHHEEKVIEFLFDGEWQKVTPSWKAGFAYRVKPEPVRDVVEMYASKKLKGFGLIAGNSTAYRITFETVDGKPDCSTIKMEEL